MNNIILTVSIITIGCMFVIPSITESEAKLWDYVIDVKFLENPIPLTKNPILDGKILDHAYRPVQGVDVKITLAGESYVVQTDENGQFGKQFYTHDLKPRTYTVQIIASSDDGKKSMTRTVLLIEGHQEKDAKYDRQLEFMEMANDPSKLRKNSNDPISVILYDHYLKLQDKAIKAKQAEKLLDLPQQKIREIRQMINEKLEQRLAENPLDIKKFHDSKKYSQFLQNLDDTNKHLFELQMNSTKIRLNEAQTLMQDMLKNGTSYDQARLAYLDYLSITHEEMNSFTKNIQKNQISDNIVDNSTKN